MSQESANDSVLGVGTVPDCVDFSPESWRLFYRPTTGVGRSLLFFVVVINWLNITCFQWLCVPDKGQLNK